MTAPSSSAPAACMTVGSGQGGAVDVLFGCMTIPLE